MMPDMPVQIGSASSSSSGDGNCKVAGTVLSQCATRTTVEGLPNLFTAGSFWRKMIWLLILVGITAGGTVHLAQLIANFNNSGVYSTMTIDASVAEFPDVTICGLQPVSDSFLVSLVQSRKTNKITDRMEIIDGWFTGEARRQRKNEKNADYVARMKKAFFQLFEIARLNDPEFNSWLSMDVAAIVSCKFNGVPCQPKNISLAQHSRHFNCLTFSPNEEIKFAESGSGFKSGLHINIFTDSSFHPSAYQTNAEYNESTTRYYERGLSLKEFLTADSEEFPVNSILSNKHNPNGVLVTLHPRSTYPFNDHQSYILDTGSSGSFRISTIEQHRLNNMGSCNEEPLGQVTYNTVYNGGNYTQRRAFARVPEDSVHDWVQRELFKRCQCYSHRIPTGRSASNLCYSVPIGEKHLKSLPRQTANRIACHDEWLQKAQSAADKSVQQKQSCNSVYREIQLESMEWPSDEDIVPFAISLVNMLHHKSKDADKLKDSGAVSTDDEESREVLQIKSISSCKNISKLIETNLWQATKCLKTNVVKQNVIRIVVRLDSAYTMAYNESYSYDVWEILSEVGGVLGFWSGISLLTVFELIELLWILATSLRQQQPNRAVEENKGLEQLKLALTLDDRNDLTMRNYTTAGCSMCID